MDGLDESAILTDYQNLPDDITSLSKGKAMVNDILKQVCLSSDALSLYQVTRGIENLVTTAQDTTYLARMLTAHDQMTAYFSLMKNKSEKYVQILAKAQDLLKTLSSTSPVRFFKSFAGRKMD
jgi:hypothetical protein